MCVSWYRRLKPGDIISLRRYRVKQHYQAEADDIGRGLGLVGVWTGNDLGLERFWSRIGLGLVRD